MIVELILFYIALILTGGLAIYLKKKPPAHCPNCGDTVTTEVYDTTNGTTIKVKACRSCKKKV